MLLILQDHVRHTFCAIFASAKTTHSLSATQEAQSHVDSQAIRLEAFGTIAIGPIRSLAFPRQWTPVPPPYRLSVFHMYWTADSEWTANPEFPSSCDKHPERRQGQKTMLRGCEGGPARA